MAESRLLSLDAFRGMTIAAMVLVNNPGSWSHIYDPLEHAAWHGLTPTDWIFPFFLFIVGVAIPIALGRQLDVSDGGRPPGALYRRIVQRSVLIFALGLAISVVPFFQFQASDAPDAVKLLIWIAMSAALFTALMRRWRWTAVLAGISIAGVVAANLIGYNLVTYSFETMRIPGVLQRIAVCYLITSLVYLHTSWRQQLAVAAGLLLAYWGLMTLVPVPGCDITTVDDKACNLAAYLDRLILTENHIWRGGRVFDPEGILSTLPAIATTLSGVLTGTWLMSRPQKGVHDELTDHAKFGGGQAALDKVTGMFFFGTVLTAAGYIWSSYFPLNKSLWTSSYVLVTSGLALLVLACCYWLIDVKGYRRWAWAFVVFGVNALTLFVFSGIFARMLGAVRVAGADGQPMSLQKWIYDNVYLSVAQPIDASLLYALSFIIFWLLMMWLLYRKRIFVKV
jgi:predicted acyltransferase